MPKKTTPASQAEPDDIVKLKPIFGIRPGVYLTVIYSIILLLILFWLFIYHGLVNYGTVLDIKTEPEGAAVRVNGVTLGTSGAKIPLPNSNKPLSNINIEVVLPGFEPQGGTYQIPGRVFGTRFFPRRYKLEYTLQTRDPAAVLAQAAAEYAAWTFGGEPTEAWQVPLVLSEAAYRIGSREQTAGSRLQGEVKTEQDILLAASRFATTRAALRDLARAKFLLDNGGNAPSPIAVTNSLGEILDFLSQNHESAEWLAVLLPPETSAVVKESNWYKNSRTAGEILSKNIFPFDLPFNANEIGTRKTEFEGLSFTGSQDFYFCETPVSKTLFEAFLNENPEWQERYFDYFEDNSNVSQFADAAQSAFATGVSWNAAEAFAKWLTGRLPASMTGMEVRLPTDEEWSFAYNYGLIEDGNIWEWSADPYAPLDFYVNRGAVLTVGSPERAIFNGVSYNPFFSEKPVPLTRASMPPDFCSPVVGFRVVICPRISTD